MNSKNVTLLLEGIFASKERMSTLNAVPVRSGLEEAASGAVVHYMPPPSV